MVNYTLTVSGSTITVRVSAPDGGVYALATASVDITDSGGHSLPLSSDVTADGVRTFTFNDVPNGTYNAAISCGGETVNQSVTVGGIGPTADNCASAVGQGA
jgi:hypothetical protein